MYHDNVLLKQCKCSFGCCQAHTLVRLAPKQLSHIVQFHWYNLVGLWLFAVVHAVPGSCLWRAYAGVETEAQNIDGGALAQVLALLVALGCNGGCAEHFLAPYSWLW